MKRTINLILLIILIGGFLMSFNKKVKRNYATTVASHANWKMGVMLYSFNEYSFKTELDMAEKCGVKYVETFNFGKLGDSFGDKTMDSLNNEDISQMKQMLKERHLIMSSMYVANINGLKGWEKYFKLGQQFGVKYLVGEPAKSDLDIIDSLAGQYHMKLAIHEHARPDEYWHPDSVLAAIKRHKNIGACADLGHWVSSGLDPVRCIKTLAGHIIELHLSDVDKSGTNVDLGKGSVDFVRLVRELNRQKFTGHINVEYEHKTIDNVTDIKGALAFFNGIVAKTNN